MPDLLISRAATVEYGTADLLVLDGIVSRISAAPIEVAGIPMIDATGMIAFPGLVDAHAHVDKTTWGLPFRSHSADPGLAGLVSNELRERGRLGATVAERAGALLRECLALGTTRIRTHVDVDTDTGLGSIEGVLEAAHALRDVLQVQIVAFPQSGLLTRPGTAELLDAAISRGAEIVGGLDPAGFDRDPAEHLDVIFGIAERRGVGVDIHLHDQGDLGAWQIELIADRARATGLGGRTTISHAFALAQVAVDRQRRLADGLAAAGVALTTAAPGKHPMLPLALLAEAGVVVGLGNDGVRDLWSPHGDGDMVRRAGIVADRLGYRTDADILSVLGPAGRGGATVMGATDYGLQVGARAEIVLMRADSAVDAVLRPPRERTVIVGGTVLPPTH